MPGKASLRAGEYYAHPRNHFWDFMEALLGVKRASQYDERLTQLLSRGIALWDVLKSCTRGSSLDSDIVSSSIVPNDFDRFFRTHPSIRVVCFNGAKASLLFQKHVLPGPSGMSDVLFHKLPSTSPANASIPLDKKLEAWRVLASAA